MPVLKYHTGSGVYADLPGSIEEVTVSPTEPPVKTDLWIDTDDDTGYIPSSRLGSRNVIRNGDMSIAQRGNGPFSPGAYTLDGYRLGAAGGTVSTTRSTPVVGLSSVASTAISGQSAAGDVAYFAALIEDVGTLNNQTATLSFTAYAASGTPKIGLSFIQQFIGDGSTNVETVIGAIPISTIRSRYSVTFFVPSVAGKTIDTANKCHLYFWLSAGSNFASRASNIGIQNNTFSITDVQLEEGVSATPFERLPVQQQLAWCQRYFCKSWPQSQNIGTDNSGFPALVTNTATAVGYQGNDDWGLSQTYFPVEMRSTPTLTTYGINGATGKGTLVWGSGQAALNATTNGFSPSSKGFLPPENGGVPVGTPLKLYIQYVASAEL